MEVISGNRFCDDRGFLSFINDLDISKYKRFYLVQNHRANFVRAWHGHKFESKAVICLQGAAKIAIRPFPPAEIEDLEVKILSGDKPEAVIIPAGYYNGAMTLTEDCILMYLSDKTLEESHGDDYRMPWDWIPGVWDIHQR